MHNVASSHPTSVFDQDYTARVWSLPHLSHVVTLKGHEREIWSVEFSPVDEFVITASGDKTIRLWSIPNSQCLNIFEGHKSSVFKVQFLTGGDHVFSCGQ